MRATQIANTIHTSGLPGLYMFIPCSPRAAEMGEMSREMPQCTPLLNVFERRMREKNNVSFCRRFQHLMRGLFICFLMESPHCLYCVCTPVSAEGIFVFPVAERTSRGDVGYMFNSDLHSTVVYRAPALHTGHTAGRQGFSTCCSEPCATRLASALN